MDGGRLKILILGGYGTFGGRLAELLADEPRLALIIAGRSLEHADRFAAGLAAGADRSALVLDRDGDDLRDLLARAAPDIVVDASGPFQAYGEAPYRLVETCIGLGIDYLDLADGSGFVAGIGRFDEAARRAGVFVLSGASSFPVLTVAAAQELSRGVIRADSITGGVAPSPYAGVGLNVIRAIAGYAGKPVPIVRDGRLADGFPLTETMRFTIAPPGRLPLRNRLFSLVDVPDLRVLPAIFPGLGKTWMGAAPVPEYLHLVLIGLAWLVRLRLLPSLRPFARLFHRAVNTLAWGEHRGGMFVAMSGSTADGPLERSWHLIAEGNDGPYIPSMASAAMIRHCLAGRRPAAGARAAAGELSLADYDLVFAGRMISRGWRERKAGAAEAPLYKRILGSAFGDLPAPIRRMHELSETMTARGVAEIDRGRGIAARLIAAVIGFPDAGHEVPVEVTFASDGAAEVWTRSFAGKPFSSVQSEGHGRAEHLLLERFGPLTFGMAVVVEEGRLKLVLRRWSFLGLTLPLWLGPRSLAYESGEDDRFRFHVEIALPLVGLIVRYRGWLRPD